MTTTDTDTLTERIARAYYENRVAAIESDQERQSWPAWEDHEKADADEWRDAAAAALPIVAEEVRKAKAEALREMQEHHEREADKAQTIAARGIHLTIAGSAHMRAAEYETGGTDEHR